MNPISQKNLSAPSLSASSVLVQKVPQEGLGQHRMKDQVNEPDGTEKTAIAIIEHQQLSSRKMGCPMSTSDHLFIVRLGE